MPEVKDNNFIYTGNINDVTPLILNLTIENHFGKPKGKLVKTFIFKKDNIDFWKKFFIASLIGKPMNVKAQISFRDPFVTACSLREWDIITLEELNYIVSKLKK